MKTSVYMIVGIALLLANMSCRESQYSMLKKQNDSLRFEIQERRHIMAALHDAESMLDTIEINSKIYHNKGVEIIERLSAIHQYVGRSEKKLSRLARELEVARADASEHLMMVEMLQGELGDRIDNVTGMEDTVGGYVKVNASLTRDLFMQERLLLDLQEEIRHKHERLNALEREVIVLEEGLDISEAERHYAKAQQIESTGRKMILSPSKKRETMREALELYKKAYVLGKKDAQQNIRALQQMM